MSNVFRFYSLLKKQEGEVAEVFVRELEELKTEKEKLEEQLKNRIKELEEKIENERKRFDTEKQQLLQNLFLPGENKRQSCLDTDEEASESSSKYPKPSSNTNPATQEQAKVHKDDYTLDAEEQSLPDEEDSEYYRDAGDVLHEMTEQEYFTQTQFSTPALTQQSNESSTQHSFSSFNSLKTGSEKQIAVEYQPQVTATYDAYDFPTPFMGRCHEFGLSSTITELCHAYFIIKHWPLGDKSKSVAVCYVGGTQDVLFKVSYFHPDTTSSVAELQCIVSALEKHFALYPGKNEVFVFTQNLDLASGIFHDNRFSEEDVSGQVNGLMTALAKLHSSHKVKTLAIRYSYVPKRFPKSDFECPTEELQTQPPPNFKWKLVTRPLADRKSTVTDEALSQKHEKTVVRDKENATGAISAKPKYEDGLIRMIPFTMTTQRRLYINVVKIKSDTPKYPEHEFTFYYNGCSPIYAFLQLYGKSSEVCLKIIEYVLLEKKRTGDCDAFTVFTNQALGLSEASKTLKNGFYVNHLQRALKAIEEHKHLLVGVFYAVHVTHGFPSCKPDKEASDKVQRYFVPEPQCDKCKQCVVCLCKNTEERKVRGLRACEKSSASSKIWTCETCEMCETCKEIRHARNVKNAVN
jgi:hypothetical protein